MRDLIGSGSVPPGLAVARFRVRSWIWILQEREGALLDLDPAGEVENGGERGTGRYVERGTVGEEDGEVGDGWEWRGKDMIGRGRGRGGGGGGEEMGRREGSELGFGCGWGFLFFCKYMDGWM